MSLILSFVDPVRPARIVGPFDSVRVDGDGIREAPGGDVVAQHEKRQWKVKGERYSRLDVMSRTRVHFEHSPGGGPAIAPEVVRLRTLRAVLRRRGNRLCR